jgi:hypothetical protein
MLIGHALFSKQEHALKMTGLCGNVCSLRARLDFTGYTTKFETVY